MKTIKDIAEARPKARRGFAAMDPEQQAAISARGGKKAHELGRAHRFTAEEARRAGRKGGEQVSQDREHMAQIGGKGGRIRGENALKRKDEGNLGGCADLST